MSQNSNNMTNSNDGIKPGPKRASVNLDEHDNLMDEQTLNKPNEDNQKRPSVNNEIDDIPIPVSKPKTFEELLEQEMAKGGKGGGIEAKPGDHVSKPPAKSLQVGTSQPKREFLKRKSTYRGNPQGKPESKKYYADNFKTAEEREQEQR